MTQDILAELSSRGLVEQCTNIEALKTRLSKGPIVVYAGFDPTSDSLHVGHLVPLLNLRRFQLTGHSPIAVAGGATGMVGDPSGKSKERNLLTVDDLNANVAKIEKQLAAFIDFEGANPARLVNNYTWLSEQSFLGFLRDVGKHFSVNEMVRRDSVKQRLDREGSGITYTEFSYMLLQAFDFLHLFREHSCELQIGGSDQLGNIVSGIELIRRIEGAESHGLTSPLITKSDGSKFGKTEEGAVWLDPEKTSPFQFSQFFINTPDADVSRLIDIFTFLSVDDRAQLREATKNAPEKREAQNVLAREMTTMVHGSDAARGAEQAAGVLFGRTTASEIDAAGFEVLARELQVTNIAKDELGSGIELADLLVRTNLAPSKSQARKDIQGGAGNVNGEKIADPAYKISTAHLLLGKFILVRKGKKNSALVVVS
ncbi:MAG: tyrosine--tRNA ligase [Planctomycetes bacterium]|nr:tyrosine--tRNA ligase [Planctomycetota bacterium]